MERDQAVGSVVRPAQTSLSVVVPVWLRQKTAVGFEPAWASGWALVRVVPKGKQPTKSRERAARRRGPVRVSGSETEPMPEDGSPEKAG